MGPPTAINTGGDQPVSGISGSLPTDVRADLGTRQPDEAPPHGHTGGSTAVWGTDPSQGTAQDATTRRVPLHGTSVAPPAATEHTHTRLDTGGGSERADLTGGAIGAHGYVPTRVGSRVDRPGTDMHRDGGTCAQSPVSLGTTRTREHPVTTYVGAPQRGAASAGVEGTEPTADVLQHRRADQGHREMGPTAHHRRPRSRRRTRSGSADAANPWPKRQGEAPSQQNAAQPHCAAPPVGVGTSTRLKPGLRGGTSAEGAALAQRLSAEEPPPVTSGCRGFAEVGVGIRYSLELAVRYGRIRWSPRSLSRCAAARAFNAS